MNIEQRNALEALAGRALTEPEVAALTPLVAARTDGAIAAMLSLKADGTPRTSVTARHVTERGVKALPVLPRHRHALLITLRDAAQTTPAWFIPTLTALQIPSEDHAALEDDLKSANYWLLDADGLDVGSNGARSMLDLIAAAVPDAAPACAAAKALAEVPDPVSVSAVSNALNNIGA